MVIATSEIPTYGEKSIYADGYLYVCGNTLVKYDASTLSEVAYYTPADTYPATAVTYDGTYLYVGSGDNHLYKIDPSTMVQISEIPMPSYTNYYSIDALVFTGGTTLFAFSQNGVYVQVNTYTETSTLIKNATGTLSMAYDGRYIYALRYADEINITKIDTLNPGSAKYYTNLNYFTGVQSSIQYDGKYLWINAYAPVLLVVDPLTLEIIEEIIVEDSAGRISQALTVGEHYAYVIVSDYDYATPASSTYANPVVYKYSTSTFDKLMEYSGDNFDQLGLLMATNTSGLKHSVSWAFA